MLGGCRIISVSYSNDCMGPFLAYSQQSSPYPCLWQAYTCHLTERVHFPWVCAVPPPLLLVSPFPSSYFTCPSLLPLLPLHSPFPICFLFSFPFSSSLPLTFLLPFSSLSSTLSLFTPVLFHLLFSLLPLIGNPDWSRCKLEVEENKCRKSINSLEMILSRKRTQ